MIGNHWAAPWLVRRARSGDGRDDLRGLVLLLRRGGIAAIMLAAWLYGQWVAGNSALADVGAVSSSALATLVPALAFAIWRPDTPPRAVAIGIVAGFAAWVWVMLVPLMLPNRTDWLQHGPMGWQWLAPAHFLGLSSWSALSRGMGACLAIAILTTATAAAWLPLRRKPVDASFDVQALRQATRRFIPAKRLDALLQDAPAQGPHPCVDACRSATAATRASELPGQCGALHRRGSVLLGVRRIDGGLRVDVFDTGLGIPASAQKRMFEEFRRGDGARGQGLGLGLSIAERIADVLQAPMSLHSRVGQGTRFGLRIPLHTAPDDAAWHRPAATRSGQARVLLVDNDPQALVALRLLLEGWGHAVDTAGNGDAAAACLSQEAADIWIFDYHLDDGDTGLALHARLCRRFAARPTLIVSADSDAQVRQAVNDAGLSLLGQPLKPLALKSLLDGLLAARRYQSPSS